MRKLRFYLDEHLPLQIAKQLNAAGIDTVSVRGLELLGTEDEDHLRRATRMERVLCTHDQDFLRLAAQGIEHTGIVFARQTQASIGGWMKGLRGLYEAFDAESAKGQVFFLSMQ